ncbi:MAG: glycosyl transferase, partial [Methylacidiphilales bacterium]|nr:glycosyl transferase [Candidatus Methylacidiphilales bacterium]
MVDGLGCAIVRADAFAPVLLARGFADPCHGFLVRLDADIVAEACVVEARLANLGTPVGAAIRLDDPLSRAELDEATAATGLDWLGGLRFTAWIADVTATGPIDVFVDGDLVDRMTPTGWKQVALGAGGSCGRSFDIHLPERFADGCVHRIAAASSVGIPFGEGPMAFVAFPDGLARTLEMLGDLDSEKLRGEMFDRLLPMSWPMARYAEWRTRFAPLATPAIDAVIAVAVVGEHDDATRDSLLAQHHPHWVSATIDAIDVVGFSSAAVLEFLSSDDGACDIVLFCLAGTRLDPRALDRIVAAFAAQPTAVLVHGDVDLLDEAGGLIPLALPAFDYTRQLEQGAAALFFAVRRDVALAVLEAGPADLYSLFLAALGVEEPEAAVLHLPGSLAELPRFDHRPATRRLAAASIRHLAA